MAIAERHGLPVALWVGSATPHEVTLVHKTLHHRFTRRYPKRLIGDKAYDSNPLDTRLKESRGIEMIAPHRLVRNRKQAPTQDGRPLRRYKRRWKVERLFAWLHNFRRIVTRWDYQLEFYLGFVQLGCILILLRQF